MGDINSPERVYKTYNGQIPDRVPIQDLIANIGVLEHYGKEKINSKNSRKVTIRALKEILDISQCEISIPENLEPSIIKDDDGFVYKCEWWTQTILERPFKTVKELTKVVESDIDKIYTSIADKIICADATLGSLMRSSRDLPISMADAKEAYANLSKELYPTVLIAPANVVCLETAYVRSGLDLFVYLYADNPELVSKWLEALNEYEICKINEIADTSIGQIALPADDIGYNMGLLFPKLFLDKEFFPRLKKLNDAWKSYGYKILFHSDGDYRPVLTELINTGIDAINPVDTGAGLWVGDLRKNYPELIFTNPIDCNTLLTRGSVQEVKDTVKKAFNESGKNSRLTLGSSLQVQPACNPDNVIAMYETIKNYCKYEI